MPPRSGTRTASASPSATSRSSPDPDQPRDAVRGRRPGRDRGADEQHRRGERDPQVDGVDAERLEQAERPGGREQDAEHGQEQRGPPRRGGGGHGRGRGPDAACRRGRRPPLVQLPPDERAADQHGGQPEVARVRPEGRVRERDQQREADQPDADRENRPVAVVAERLLGDRRLRVLVRDHEPGGQVQEQAGAAGERERREDDPVDRGVDVEVAAEAGGDAAEPAPVAGADEPAHPLLGVGRRRGRLGGVFHDSLLVDDAPRIAAPRARRHRVTP